MRRKRWIGVIFVVLFLLINFNPDIQMLRSLPSQIVAENRTAALGSLDIPFFAKASYENDSTVSSGQDQSLEDVTSPVSQEKIEISILGIPIKQIDILTNEEKAVVVGGQSIGVALYTKGALLVGTSDVIDSNGQTRNPALEAGLKPGDIIEAANGETIEDAAHLSEIINEMGSREFVVEISRNQETMHFNLTPVYDAYEAKYKLGMWVRDSTAGVGTLTYYDPVSQNYASLGHPITDVDTQEILSVKDGEIVASEIIDIRQGMAGDPGELQGSFSSKQEVLGSIEKNNEFGIYGKMYEELHNPIYTHPVAVAKQEEVRIGKASILSTIDSGGIQEFECEVVKATKQTTASPKGMIIKITDAKLLEQTGGIVQGMSGSPILQGGKLIGAVTHVFINDPTQGYGMYIEWMLQQSE
ncbi:MAG: SpoIVB peptidase [Christensenellales bacterium]|jgi:stage IV sporulation protein B